MTDVVRQNPRAEDTRSGRRRRSDSYRGYDLRLEVPEHLKNPDYVYRWINDDKGRLQYRTTQDDWDFVTRDELNIATHDDLGFDQKNLNQTEGRIRREVDSRTSARPIFAYLCKKRRDYYEADFKRDMQEQLDRRKNLIQSQRGGPVGEDKAAQGDFARHSYLPGEVREAIDETDRRIRRGRPPLNRKPIEADDDGI